jgi:hypothetical protein
MIEMSNTYPLKATLNMMELLARVANNATDSIIINNAIWHLYRLGNTLKLTLDK